MEVAPLAVCAGEKDPQVGALPQIATQSMPAFAMSLAAVAETLAMALTDIEVGGTCVSTTEMMGVSEVLVFALFEQPATPRESKATRDRSAPQRRVRTGKFISARKDSA